MSKNKSYQRAFFSSNIMCLSAYSLQDASGRIKDKHNGIVGGEVLFCIASVYCHKLGPQTVRLARVRWLHKKIPTNREPGNKYYTNACRHAA